MHQVSLVLAHVISTESARSFGVENSASSADVADVNCNFEALLAQVQLLTPRLLATMTMVRTVKATVLKIDEGAEQCNNVGVVEHTDADVEGDTKILTDGNIDHDHVGDSGVDINSNSGFDIEGSCNIVSNVSDDTTGHTDSDIDSDEDLGDDSDNDAHGKAIGVS